MARIIKETSTLERDASQLRGLKLISLALVATVVLYYRTPLAIVSGVAAGVFIVAETVLGARGERRVFRLLKNLPDEYCILNDVTIRYGDQEAQIDHVLVSIHGIWCIETKDHVGWIYGNDRWHEWTQTKRSSGGRIYKKRFHSPVKQNYVHCIKLQNYLYLKLGVDVSIKSIVVFTSAERLEVESSTLVVSPRELTETILSWDPDQELSEEQVEKLAELLSTA